MNEPAARDTAVRITGMRLRRLIHKLAVLNHSQPYNSPPVPGRDEYVTLVMEGDELRWALLPDGTSIDCAD